MIKKFFVFFYINKTIIASNIAIIIVIPKNKSEKTLNTLIYEKSISPKSIK